MILRIAGKLKKLMVLAGVAALLCPLAASGHSRENKSAGIQRIKDSSSRFQM